MSNKTVEPENSKAIKRKKTVDKTRKDRRQKQ